MPRSASRAAIVLRNGRLHAGAGTVGAQTKRAMGRAGPAVRNDTGKPLISFMLKAMLRVLLRCRKCSLGA